MCKTESFIFKHPFHIFFSFSLGQVKEKFSFALVRYLHQSRRTLHSISESTSSQLFSRGTFLALMQSPFSPLLYANFPHCHTSVSQSFACIGSTRIGRRRKKEEDAVFSLLPSRPMQICSFNAEKKCDLPNIFA